VTISEPETTRRGAGGPPGAGTALSRRRLRWWHWLIAASGLVLVAAVAVLWPLAATYQPVQFGGAAGGDPGSSGFFPGMPAGAGQRVNYFGAQQGQIYVAPRSGAFTIVESIINTGPKPVTIEAISALAPGWQQVLPWPLTSAGPVQWALFEQTNPPLPRSVAACSYSTPCQLSHLSLAPQEDIELAIPVRFVDACYDTSGWTGASFFYVEERFGPFTHWVKVPYGTPYLFHEPEPAGTGDSICLAR
jgi:hypothetical protein